MAAEHTSNAILDSPVHNDHLHLHVQDSNNGIFRDSAPGDAMSQKSSDPEKDHKSINLDKDVEKCDTSGEDGDDMPPPMQQSEPDPNLVGFDGPDDPLNPMNWPRSKKYLITIAYSTLTLCLTFASSVFSTATFVTADLFHVSPEVMTLGTSLFVLGFAVGPIIWGPLSELYGRKPPLFFGFACFAILQIPVAVATNIETIMLARFLGGTFGSAPIAIVGGALADFWGPVDRGFALGLFAGATFIGPAAGPIVGGFLTESYLSWRWTAWITLIIASFFGLVALYISDESYVPVILQQKASKLKFESKNWAIHAPIDEHPVDIREIVQKYLYRPWIMLAREPILLLITIYMSFIYGMIYLFFEAYPIAFQEQRGWSLGVGALPFLGITIGVIIGVAIITYFSQTRYKQKLIANGGKPVPEERLVPMIIGAFLLPIGLFWFAWTSDKNITWVPQVIAGIPIGAGIMMVFLQGISYIIDVYLMYANSAIAGNTFLRSLAGAGFPLFASGMYHNLGVAWATSLLGFLCVAFSPVPILFFVYGKRIRGLSKFAPQL